MGNDSTLRTELAAPSFRYPVDSLRRTGVIPIFIIVLMLSLTLYIFLPRDMAISVIAFERWRVIGTISIHFVVLTLVLDIISSIKQVNQFHKANSNDIDIKKLIRAVYTNPVSGIVFVAVTTFGVTAAQGLSEYYRLTAKVWYDDALFGLEGPLFIGLKRLGIPWSCFFDFIYYGFWTFKTLVFAVLYRGRHYHNLAVYSMATVFAYMITRLIAIQFPTAGPIFYKTELFDLAATKSDLTRRLLLDYMAGIIPQNGLYPGTMAMPSLHVGLTCMAAWFLSAHYRKMLWPAAIWCLLTWISTIVLGWHYVVDGIGGIFVAFLAVVMARAILKILPSSVKPESAER